MIKIAHLSKRYHGAASAALDDVSLTIDRGHVFGLLGPNGAGKTTLISILTGMLQKDVGDIRVGDLSLDRDLPAIRRRIGYVPQQLAFYPSLTAGENLRIFSTLSGGSGEQIRFSVETANLGRHLDQAAGTLSGGLQRRLNLAIGLLGKPDFLLLDEPTVGVDPQSRHFLIQTIRSLAQQGITVLYTTHYMDEIERACERIAILDHGRIIAEGPLKTLLAQGDANLEALFLRLTQHGTRDD
ncbi:MAG TPA: ABC transporter ATP-binding protein [Stenotrophobium sp.]|nr:ABC transporter ATP-binding protein [Stenotrophobium sp.]